MITLEVVALSPMAREWVERYRRRRDGRRLRDAHGRVVEIGDWRPEDWDGLLAMYRSFDPTQRAQGLPPLGEERQAVWVDELWRRGPNVVARAGGRVVGHAALVPCDGAATYELVVFVHQDYQGAGVGTALVDALLALAGSRGAERVWLSVERYNYRAAALYRRLGFERVSKGWREETWALSLPAASLLRSRRASSPAGAWTARLLRGAWRAWRRAEAAVAELPWSALGPAPLGWVLAGRPAPDDAVPEAAGR
jgi:RimJ/RimL family protein N-acetyltransferase